MKMSKNKSSISQASSYRAIGEFWDTHDLTDYWDQTYPVEFEIDIQEEELHSSTKYEARNMKSEIRNQKLVVSAIEPSKI